MNFATLKSKVVLVTGASDNIGRAIALRFAEHGARLVINSRSNVEGGKKVVDEIESLGAEAIYVQADVSQPDAVASLFDAIVANFGTIDVLINNAGVVHEKPFLNLSKNDWLQAFDANFFTSVLCSQAAAKIMVKNGSGKIINNASIRGLDYAGRQGIMPYSAAKAALISFTRTLAKDLAPHINVNAVAPGYTLTSAFDGVPQETKDMLAEGALIKRWLNVDEIADAFLYLSVADGVTGEVLVVDGGWSLR